MYYKVNFNYIGTNNNLRTGAIIIDAKDAKTAETEAKKRLTESYPAYKLTSINPWTPS